MLSIEIGRDPQRHPKATNKKHLPLCKAIQLDRVYGDITDGKYLSLSFSWIAEDLYTGRRAIENIIIPLTAAGMPKPMMGIFYLVQNSSPIVVRFDNVKENITVECVGKAVPIDFTLRCRVLD